MMSLFSFFSPKASAAPKDPRDSQSPFGVLDFLPWDHEWNGHHYTPEKAERAVRLMKEAGVAFVRMDFLWDDVEPVQGQWHFEKYDRLVKLLSDHGIKILGLLDYSAGWTADNWNAAPDPPLFAEYAKKVVSRYKDRVKYWEIWNEPNQDIYWMPQDRMKAYTALLKKVYPVIKGEDATSIVLLGGLAADAAPALEDVYGRGGKDFFDRVNFHPFENPLDSHAIPKVKAAYEAVRAVMKKYHDEKKTIWLTELGCPGMPAAKEAREWWKGQNPDEKTQAAWVEKIYEEVLRWPGIEKVFWAFFRDTPDHFLTGTDYFGLLREDFSKKPSYEAYRKAATGKSPASKDNS